MGDFGATPGFPGKCGIEVASGDVGPQTAFAQIANLLAKTSLGAEYLNTAAAFRPQEKSSSPVFLPFALPFLHAHSFHGKHDDPSRKSKLLSSSGASGSSLRGGASFKVEKAHFAA